VAAHRVSAVANCDQLLDLGKVQGAVKTPCGFA
jgi:hypothetical protein